MKDFSKELIPLIGKTAKLITVSQTKGLRQAGFDLTKEQFIVLLILSQQNGVAQNKLACLTGRDKASMTRLVNTMERKTLIKRTTSRNDKRINQLFITTTGEKILHEVSPIVKDNIYQLQNGVSKEEIDLVMDVLKRIQNNLVESHSC